MTRMVLVDARHAPTRRLNGHYAILRGGCSVYLQAAGAGLRHAIWPRMARIPPFCVKRHLPLRRRLSCGGWRITTSSTILMLGNNMPVWTYAFRAVGACRRHLLYLPAGGMFERRNLALENQAVFGTGGGNDIFTPRRYAAGNKQSRTRLWCGHHRFASGRKTALRSVHDNVSPDTFPRLLWVRCYPALFRP